MSIPIEQMSIPIEEISIPIEVDPSPLEWVVLWDIRFIIVQLPTITFSQLSMKTMLCVAKRLKGNICFVPRPGRVSSFLT